MHFISGVPTKTVFYIRGRRLTCAHWLNSMKKRLQQGYQYDLSCWIVEWNVPWLIRGSWFCYSWASFCETGIFPSDLNEALFITPSNIWCSGILILSVSQTRKIWLRWKDENVIFILCWMWMNQEMIFYPSNHLPVSFLLPSFKFPPYSPGHTVNNIKTQ
jgi:hypothetical protein